MSLIYFTWKKGNHFPNDPKKLDTYLLYPWSAIVNLDFPLLKEANLFRTWEEKSDCYIYYNSKFKLSHTKVLDKFLDDL